MNTGTNQRSYIIKKEPILFVFGPARGGTTYMGSILDQFFNVGIGPEGTFIPKAALVAKKLGDLSDPANRLRFAEYLSRVEMLEIIRKRYPLEKQFDVTPEDILGRMTGDSFSDGIFAVFKAVADYKGKSVVGNKNPEYWKYLHFLLETFPENSYFLFILRDGRDVALSLRGVPWGGHSSYEAANEWRTMIKAVERFKKNIPKERFLTVRYEDFLQQPAKEIGRIGSFLNVINLSKIITEFQKSFAKNVKKNNFNKWKTQMSKKDIETFEALAWKELEQSHYEKVHSNPHISIVETQILKFRRLKRLIKLNLYNIGRKLPQDKKKWQKSKFKAFFRPGAKEK